MCNNRRAFTLIELSIVLIIIGLLVGGVLVGRDLIQQAQIRTTITELTNLETELRTFQLKYDGLPGDLDNGFDFFGTACGTDSLVTSVATGCNGTGNNRVARTPNFGETVLFWKHLGLSGIRSFVPTYTTLPQPINPIEHGPVPNGFDGGIYNIEFLGEGFSSGLHPETGHIVLLHGFQNATVGHTTISMTPSEAQQIDDKMDDGRWRGGRVYGFGAVDGGSPCVLTATERFAVEEDAIRCAISYFFLGAGQ